MTYWVPMSLFLIIFTSIAEIGSIFVWYVMKSTVLIEYVKTSEILFYIFVIMPIIAILSFILSWSHYSKSNVYLYTMSVWWLGLILYLFIGSVLAGILYSVGIKTGLSLETNTFLAWTIYVGAIFITFYGTYNATRTRITSYTLPKALFPESWNKRKIVLVSDIHMGQVNGEEFLKRTIEKINSIKADIVFIAGDLIDGPKFPLDWLSNLDNIKTPLGTYFTSGNHETYSREFVEIMKELSSHTKLLEDTSMVVDGVQIGGISFHHESTEETAKTLKKLDFNKDIPSICMLHDPKNVSALIDKNITLTLSGHTHGGQLFPGNLIVKKIYGIFAYGMHKVNNTHTLTTSGVGTAQSPIRVGTQSEIVVIEIN